MISRFLSEVTVSIHAPGRGATLTLPHFDIVLVVSIHAPGRGATFIIYLSYVSITFQFTHPGGVRRSAPYQLLLSVRFQFTHPGGVRLCLVHLVLLVPLFQFTHPGGVRPRQRGLHLDNLIVSIHAPGRGATSNSQKRFARVLFQFTHPGGVRQQSESRAKSLPRSFNSRTREGCDVSQGGQSYTFSSVSIHAPGRGATRS